MSSTQNASANIPNKNAHVREIKHWDPSTLPIRIDEHAGSGWNIFCSWVSTGGTEFVPELDSYTEVADKHARLPEGLRQRLDAVFAGLARGVDPNTSYEEQFIGIETEWHQRMRTATSRSKGSSKKRLQLSKIAALEMVPTFEVFFNDLRTHLCGGGQSYGWREGDRKRAEWDFGYFGEKFSVWSRQ